MFLRSLFVGVLFVFFSVSSMAYDNYADRDMVIVKVFYSDNFFGQSDEVVFDEDVHLEDGR